MLLVEEGIKMSDIKKSDFPRGKSFSSDLLRSRLRYTYHGIYVSGASLDFMIIQIERQSTGWPFRQAFHSLSRRHSEMGFGVYSVTKYKPKKEEKKFVLIKKESRRVHIKK